MKNSKFYVKTPFKERLIDFTKGLLFWRGRKKGMIHTRDIDLSDICAVFFPVGFYEKYKYLGSVPWNFGGEIFKAMEPLVIFMDYKAKPWWCPRWFLRFLHLFGSDNSIVRVRNRTLHDLQYKLTKGIMIIDYKTKWTDYDLRISVYGDNQIQNLADSIETRVYDTGAREDLSNQILELDPNTKYTKGHTVQDLRKELYRLEDINEENN
jgi:hypothetical protein